MEQNSSSLPSDSAIEDKPIKMMNGKMGEMGMLMGGMGDMSMAMTFNTKLPLSLLFDDIQLRNSTGISSSSIELIKFLKNKAKGSTFN